MMPAHALLTKGCVGSIFHIPDKSIPEALQVAASEGTDTPQEGFADDDSSLKT